MSYVRYISADKVTALMELFCYSCRDNFSRIRFYIQLHVLKCVLVMLRCLLLLVSYFKQFNTLSTYGDCSLGTNS